jgi:hypothetical protein
MVLQLTLMPWPKLNLVKGNANDSAKRLICTTKGSYLYRSLIGGEYNNAQKPFQEVQTGDSINKLAALRNENKRYFRIDRRS